MNKEQAQIYINNIGQAYKHYTRAVYFGFLFIALVFLGGAVGFCHELPMVIITCALADFAIIFTFVVVKKYMSVLRISVVNCIYIGLWAVALDCIAYSDQYFNGSFVWWEYCICIAIQLVVFAVSSIVCLVVAQKAMPKKVVIAGVTTAAVGGTAGISVSRFITNSLHPDPDTELLIIVVLTNIVACLFLIAIAILLVRIVIMRKYGVEYRPEKLVVSDTRKAIKEQKSDIATTVYGFAYGAYTFYIYAKRDNFRIDIYDGNTRISRNKYDTIEELFDKQKIDDKKLDRIWDSVMPL